MLYAGGRVFICVVYTVCTASLFIHPHNEIRGRRKFTVMTITVTGKQKNRFVAEGKLSES